MNDTQIHPEDLLDRAKRQTLDGGDERLLRAHLDGCAACRFELSLAPALYRHVRLDAGDHALIARAIKKTRDLNRAERSPTVWRRMPAAAALAVALLAGAVMASAAGYVWHRRDTIVVEELPSKATQRSAPPRGVARPRATVVPLATTPSSPPSVTEAPQATGTAAAMANADA
ncbi:MAG TPA: zf-HC2 domain-containing protein, partial [Polyangia bacterium]|nr:zf-HC2 domain-containing protein [Polyangia bacterium]